MSYRLPSTNRVGQGFNWSTVEQVWKKGRPVAGYNPNQVRADLCGALMSRSAYGDTNSKYGWEIDHIRPVAHGGSDDFYNLQPLQWQNNRHKSDNWPNYSCAVGA